MVDWRRFKRKDTVTNPFTESWFHFRCTLVGHLIFIHGGHGFAQTHLPEELFEYNVRKHTWKRHLLRGSLPSSINGNAMVLVNDQILTLGVGGLVTSMNVVHAVDLASYSWQQIAIKGGDGFLPRNYMVAHYWEDRNIVLINAAQENSNERWNATKVLNLGNWELSDLKATGDPPSSRMYQSAFFLDSRQKWFIVGGEIPGEFVLLADVRILSFVGRHQPVWSTVEKSLRTVGCGPLRAASLAVVSSSLLIIGGVRPDGDVTEIVAYDFDADELTAGGVVHTGEAPDATDYRFHQLVLDNNGGCFMLSSDPRTEGENIRFARYGWIGDES